MKNEKAMAKDKKTIIVNDGLLYRYSGNAVQFDIPEGVTEIGCQAFLYCSKLESVTIPDSVIYIGYEEYRKNKGFCMRCKHGSAAEVYAWKNNLEYSSFL